MASEFSSSLWLENLSSSFGESLENVDDLFQSPEAILADVVSGVLRGNISTNDFISALKSFREDLKSDLLDSVLSVLWIEGNQIATNTDAEKLKLYQGLVKEMVNGGVIDLNTFKMTLELPTLADCGYTKDVDGLQKRLVKINTGFVYKQQKYNLLREETEGYSKLVIFLETMVKNTDENVAGTQNNINSIMTIIGQFDLDPNRVADIMLDILEQHPFHATLWTIFTQFRQNHICHIIGFKLSQYQPSTSNVKEDDPKPEIKEDKPLKVNEKEKQEKDVGVDKKRTPSSLLLITALLLMNRIIKFEELLPYLTDSIVDTRNSLVAYNVELQKYAKENPSSSTAIMRSGWENVMRKDTKLRQGNQHMSLNSPLAEAVASDYSIALDGIANKIPPPPPGPPPSNSTTTSSTSNAAAASSASTTKPPPPSYPPPPSVLREKDASQTEDDYVQPEYPLFRTNSNDETTATAENQFLGIISHLIRLRAWKFVKSLLNVYLFTNELENNEKNFDTLMLYEESIQTAFVALISWCLNDLYSEHFSMGSFHLSSSEAESISSVIYEHKIAISEERILPVNSLHSLLDWLKDMVVNGISYHIVTNNAAFKKVAELLCLLLSRFTSGLEAAFDNLEIKSTVLLISAVLLNALALSGADATYYNHLLWPILQYFSYSDRYYLYYYYQHSSSTNSRPIPVIVSEKNILLVIRKEMKRLAKENLKPMSKLLTKYIHCNSIIVGGHMIQQMTQFENLIPYVVEVLRYSMILSRDIFSYLIYRQLHKHSQISLVISKDINESQSWSRPANWNEYLIFSKFVGLFYARYYFTELGGLVDYISRGLSAGAREILFILKELLTSMGHCEILLNVSSDQLEALMGGKILRQEILYTSNTGVTNIGSNASGGFPGSQAVFHTVSSGISTSSSTNPSASKSSNGVKKSASILREVFFASNAAIPLFVYLTILRQSVLHASGTDCDDDSYEASLKRHVKTIASAFDLAQEVLVQFTDFLIVYDPDTIVQTTNSSSSISSGSQNKNIEKVMQILPSFSALLVDMSLPSSLVFQLIRPCMRYALTQIPLSLLDSDYQNNNDEGKTVERWHPLSKSLQDVLRATSSYQQWGFRISSQLYTLFWSLTLYDLYTPTDRYSTEIKRIKDKYTELDHKKSISTTGNISSGANDLKSSKQRDQEMKSLMMLMTNLQDEVLLQKKYVDSMKEYILSVTHQNPFFPRVNDDLCLKDKGFSPEDSIASMEVFLQHFVVPRLCLSPCDAVYCIKFAKLFMHDLFPDSSESSVAVTEVPWSLLFFYDSLLQYVLPRIFTSTEQEAMCTGYAFQEMFGNIVRWLSSKTLCHVEGYQKQPAKFWTWKSLTVSTIATGTKQQNTATDRVLEDGQQEEEPICLNKENYNSLSKLSSEQNFQLYSQLCKVWHTQCTTIFLSALSSKEYIYIRNALLVLSKINAHFPFYQTEGQLVLQQLELLLKEEREDLQMMARSIHTLLKKQANAWIRDQAGVAISSGSKPTKSNTQSGGNASKSNQKNVVSSKPASETQLEPSKKVPVVPSNGSSKDSQSSTNSTSKLHDEKEKRPIDATNVSGRDSGVKRKVSATTVNVSNLSTTVVTGNKEIQRSSNTSSEEQPPAKVARSSTNSSATAKSNSNATANTGVSSSNTNPKKDTSNSTTGTTGNNSGNSSRQSAQTTSSSNAKITNQTPSTLNSGNSVKESIGTAKLMASKDKREKINGNSASTPSIRQQEDNSSARSRASATGSSTSSANPPNLSVPVINPQPSANIPIAPSLSSSGRTSASNSNSKSVGNSNVPTTIVALPPAPPQLTNPGVSSSSTVSSSNDRPPRPPGPPPTNTTSSTTGYHSNQSSGIRSSTYDGGSHDYSRSSGGNGANSYSDGRKNYSNGNNNVANGNTTGSNYRQSNNGGNYGNYDAYGNNNNNKRARR